VTLVVDSSVVVAALIDNGSVGEWAESLLMSGPVAAPHLMPAEVANILRRSALAGDVSADVASLAHGDLGLLRLELFPYSLCASRVWELRSNVNAYDAWHVALAETLDAPLATLDLRLSRAAGVRCEIVLPPDPAPTEPGV
jgi:predicted nucleic acid-binding protein